jgi:hypothetical protein
MAYQYGSCNKRKAVRIYQPVKYPVPTLRDLDLALCDVTEMGFDCATEWSQYVINYFDKECDTEQA